MTHSALIARAVGFFVGLLPVLALLTLGCGRGAQQADVRVLEEHGLQLETPRGWTRRRVGGIYEFHGSDGTGRVRIAPLEGVTAVAGLKEAQLLSGTGATATNRVHPPSSTRAGSLPALRSRVQGSDGRTYGIVAVQTAKGVVLVQTSVPASMVTTDPEAVEQLFSSVRQSIRPIEPAR